MGSSRGGTGAASEGAAAGGVPPAAASLQGEWAAAGEELTDGELGAFLPGLGILDLLALGVLVGRAEGDEFHVGRLHAPGLELKTEELRAEELIPLLGVRLTFSGVTLELAALLGMSSFKPCKTHPPLGEQLQIQSNLPYLNASDKQTLQPIMSLRRLPQHYD